MRTPPLIALALALAACSTPAPLLSGPGDTNPGATPLPSSSAPAGSATFRSVYEHIIAKRCALPTCHGGSFEPDLSTATGAYDGLVNAPAFARPKTYRVRAGDPERSFLLERLTLEAPLPRMPFNLPPLDPAEITLIRQWIADGARFEAGGPDPVLPDFPAEPPVGFVYRGGERIDDPPPAVVRVEETVTLWVTPNDFESAASCTLPHDGDACIPWAAFGLFDAQYRGVCIPNPYAPRTYTPYRVAEFDDVGRATASGFEPGWRFDLTLPATGLFAPILANGSCDEANSEELPLAGMTLHLAPVFPEDETTTARIDFAVQLGHLRVEAP